MRVSGVHARVVLCVYVLAILATSVVAILNNDTAYAAQITNRSLQLKQHTGVTTGGSAIGGVADHAFTFSVPSATSVQSVGFQYCTTATGTCTMPTGLVTTASTATGLTGGVSGWTLTNGTNGAPFIKGGSAGSLSGANTVTLANITNPTTTSSNNGITFYVRITTYTGNDGSTGATDAGVVAAATTQTITLTGVMPEYIQFCTGATVTVNCGTVTAGAVSFNQEFSPSDTATAQSQMAASTNAGSGYVITVTGTTLTSGSNTIPQVGGTATAVAGARGSSKFGMNLVANTTAASTPAVGSAVAPASNGTNLQANPTTNFATADSFALDLTGGAAIAKSDQGTPGTSKPTDSQVYNVSYFVDVAGSQAPGTYVATLNYVCTATF